MERKEFVFEILREIAPQNQKDFKTISYILQILYKHFWKKFIF